ncbi:MAG TPA: Crp/Fnr family transcriptional regulator [Chitinophagaceae bacterium]|nr:Crp/Fnr family transcriptional regulator [Chitinophagaceae bacterium]
MSMKEYFQSLFEPELIEAIEKQGNVISVKTDDVVLEAGQTVRAFPFVISGLLKISRPEADGKELLLYYINPGESCAMSFTCCMQQFPSEIRAVAEEDSELLLLPVGVMDEWLVKFPSWKSFVMRTIRYRFQELLQTLDQVTFQKLDDRLVYYLKEKSKVTGSPLLNLSHEQVATDLATSRVVVSRLLKALENKKKLLLYRNQIRLLKDL